jgi:hypothetical protein
MEYKVKDRVATDVWGDGVVTMVTESAVIVEFASGYRQVFEPDGRWNKKCPVSLRKTVSLWIEGYVATGEKGEVQCIGTYNAIDIDDAVKQYMKDHPNSVAWDRFGRGRHAIWASEIYDNESDAKS